MNYGTTAYGSTAIGGATASEWQTFFPFLHYDEGSYEARAEMRAAGELSYSVMFRKTSDLENLTGRVYTYNDEGETPQLQATTGIGLFSQIVVGAARFMIVQVEISLAAAQFSVTGRPGD